jgi:hypothetical protein
MAKYRKKPVVIEAVRWNGDNQDVISTFIGDNGYVKGIYIDSGAIEGLITASNRDYIIKCIKDEFYPCKPDIFEMTYEAV